MTGNIVHHDRIHITRNQRLYRKTEGIIADDPLLTNQFDSRFVVSCSDLNANGIIALLYLFDARKAVFVYTHENTLLKPNVAIRKVYDLAPFLSDGNPISRHVIFTIGDSYNHPIPADFNKLRRTIQTLADFGEGIIIPASGFAGFFVNKVEGNVSIFNGDRHHTTFQIGQVILCHHRRKGDDPYQ